MSNKIAVSTALAALALSMPAPAAQADSVTTFNCVGTRGSGSCAIIRRNDVPHPNIRTVPQPVSEEDRALAQARDKRWVARCQPVIRQDEFGVPRYSYAARGCEFGKLD